MPRRRRCRRPGWRRSSAPGTVQRVETRPCGLVGSASSAVLEGTELSDVGAGGRTPCLPPRERISTLTRASSRAADLAQALVHAEGHRVARLRPVERRARRSRTPPLRTGSRSCRLPDHSRLRQRADLLAGIADLRRTSAECSPSSGPARAIFAGVCESRIGEPICFTRSQPSVRRLGEEAARFQVRVVEHLVVGLEQPAGHAGRGERVHPVPGRLLQRNGLQQRNQLAPVLVAEVVLGEARICSRWARPKTSQHASQLRAVVAPRVKKPSDARSAW